MSLIQNRYAVARAKEPSPSRGRTPSSSERRTLPISPGRLACSDVRPEKVAKARKLIARSDYPSKRVIQSVADRIARYF